MLICKKVKRVFAKSTTNADIAKNFKY